MSEVCRGPGASLDTVELFHYFFTYEETRYVLLNFCEIELNYPLITLVL